MSLFTKSYMDNSDQKNKDNYLSLTFIPSLFPTMHNKEI